MRPAHARTGVAAAAAAALLLCSCSSSSPPREDEAHAPIRPRPGFAPDRLTVHQPVLGDVHGGAAYARRLSGRGVRIGIDDDYVDFTQRAEFGNRVERDPARGARIADKGSTTDNDIRARRNACLDDDACRERAEKNTRVIAEGRLRGNRRVQITFGSDPEEEDESPGATMDGTTGGILEEGPGAEEEGAQTTWVHVEYDSRGQRNYEQGVIEEIVGLEWVREQLRLAQDVAWILLEDRHDAEGDELSEMKRWGVIPNVEQAGEQGMIGQYHGTMVASAAAGWRYGIAPNAQIVPTTRTLEGYDWVGPGVTPQELRIQVRQGRFSQAKIEAFDARLAREQTEVYQYADIINRSWGDLRTAEAIVDEEVGTQVQFYRRHFPKLYRAFVQADTHPDDRTIVVTAAGNAGRYGRDRPSAQAQMPYHMPELRGHTLAVAASDPENGALARYSNPCGPLPSDWVASRDGRHYCLTAPGTVNALVPVAGSPGEGTTRRMRGTSFAAPLVSGGLALMMEQFRGTMGNTAIAQRMLDTANRRGRYADSHLYGAGMMDLRRALAPVGALSAGQSRSPASTTTLVTPAAFGDVTGGLAGVEIAVFDEMEFPFWQPISEMITRQAAAQDAIPEIEAPAHDIGIDALGLDWREAGPGGGLGWRGSPKGARASRASPPGTGSATAQA